MGKKYSLGVMIFDLIYNIYNFDEDVTIVFNGLMVTCRHCKHNLHRLHDRAHYITCQCGKRYMFRKRRKGRGR